MKLLKYLLYLVLSLSIIWSSLIFGGPSLIRWFIALQFDERVVPYSVRVSPWLQVNISRLEISDVSIGSSKPFSGFARAVKISPSLVNNQPFLQLTSGNLSLDDLGDFSSIAFSTAPIAKFDYKNLALSGEVKNFRKKNLGAVEELDFKAIVTDDFKNIDNFVFKAKNLSIGAWGGLTVDELEGAIENFSIAQTQKKDGISINYASTAVAYENYNATSGASTGNIKLKDSGVFFDVTFSDIKALDPDWEAESVFAEGTIAHQNLSNEVAISLNNIKVANDLLTSSNLVSKVQMLEKGRIAVDFHGDLAERELVLADTFIGRIPDGSFSATAIVDQTENNVSGTIFFDFKNFEKVKISSETGFQVKLDEPLDFTKCCSASQMLVNYQIHLDNENLKGKAVCSHGPCEVGKLSNTLVSSNTSEVFEKLRQSELISPFVIAYLYSSFIRGKKVGYGHEIEF